MGILQAPIAYRHEKLPGLPVGETWGQAASSTDHIFIAGDTAQQLFRLAIGPTLEPSEASWEEVPGPATRVEACASIVAGGYLYLIGGVVEQGFATLVQRLDLSDGQWTTVPDTPSPLGAFPSCTVDGSAIHATGNSHLILDTDSLTWRSGANLPVKYSMHFSGIFDGRLLLLGGSGEDGAVDLGTGAWSILPQFPLRERYSSVPGKPLPAAARVGPYVFFYCGPLPDVAATAWCFDSARSMWIEAPESAPALALNRSAVTSIETPEGVGAYVMGGQDVNGSASTGAELFGYDLRGAPPQVPANNAFVEEIGIAELGAIYGQDDRIEVSNISNPQRKTVAAGVAALVDAQRITLLPSGEWALHPASTLASQIAGKFPGHRLADDQKFGSQKVLAFGTAFRVGPNLVATNAHNICVEGSDNLKPLGTYKVVFGWTIDQSGSFPTELPESDVYEVTDVKRWSYQIPLDFNSTDWALLQVDRDLDASIPILEFDGNTPVVGDTVWMVGHPSGLPAKYCEGPVRDASANKTLRVALAAFEGSSGSPILNAQNKVVAVLNKGPTNDWVVSPDGQVRAKVYKSPDPGVAMGAQKVTDQRVQLGPISNLKVRITIGDSFWAGTSDNIGSGINKGSKDYGWTRGPFDPHSSYTLGTYSTTVDSPLDASLIELAKSFHAGFGTDDVLIEETQLLLDGQLWIAYSTNQWMGTGSGSGINRTIDARWIPPK